VLTTFTGTFRESLINATALTTICAATAGEGAAAGKCVCGLQWLWHRPFQLATFGLFCYLLLLFPQLQEKGQLLENVFADPKGFGIDPSGKYRYEMPGFRSGEAAVS